MSEVEGNYPPAKRGVEAIMSWSQMSHLAEQKQIGRFAEQGLNRLPAYHPLRC